MCISYILYQMENVIEEGRIFFMPTYDVFYSQHIRAGRLSKTHIFRITELIDSGAIKLGRIFGD